MRWTGDWRRPVIGVGVLVLHALVALVFLAHNFVVPDNTADKEITLVLPPLPRPAEEKKPQTAKATARGAAISHAITMPRGFEVPPQWAPPQSGNNLQGLGASLGCNASGYESLSAAQRASCNRGPWKYDRDARETASLIIKAPRPGLSAADRAWRIRSTVDPCAAEKLTHQTDCIFKVIYGDKLP